MRKTEDLTPMDKVVLTINAGDAVIEIVKKLSKMIETPTQVKEIKFSNEKQKHPIQLDLGEVSISLHK